MSAFYAVKCLERGMIIIEFIEDINCRAMEKLIVYIICTPTGAQVITQCDPIKGFEPIWNNYAIIVFTQSCPDRRNGGKPKKSFYMIAV